jgi:RimJ/RimL family protein N-acetyltransferase
MDRMDWNPNSFRNLVLEDDQVMLRRVSLEDRSGFARIAFDSEIWTYFVNQVRDDADLTDFMEQAIHDTLAGTRAVFAIVDRDSGQVVGSSAYGNFAPREKRLEIGWSWLGVNFRRTGHNRTAKRLLLDQAFGPLECERVEFKTDVLNTGARRALEAIGAREEGVLRSFNFMPGGRRRDAVYYSILRHEWNDVRNRHFTR